jgi:hypothetical protein
MISEFFCVISEVKIITNLFCQYRSSSCFICTDVPIFVDSGALPRRHNDPADEDDDSSDGDIDADGQRDFEDQDLNCAPSSTANVVPLLKY